MTIARRFALAVETFVELNSEEPPPPTTPAPAQPTLNGVLSAIGSLPREALFLGVATDGLPVLLNLNDPIPGPLLIAGDGGSGKTAFLKVIARAAQQTHHSADLQFGVVTHHPEEWEDIPSTDHHVGIFPVQQNSSHDFLFSLAGWAHKSQSKQAVLLLIDDLEAIARLNADILQSLRWLLLRGPARKVWPIVTMNAERYGQVLSWIPMFRTRVFGRIEKEGVAEALGGDKASALDRLEAGVQFSLRENGRWLRFWLPAC
jgi:hypothetical protein